MLNQKKILIIDDEQSIRDAFVLAFVDTDIIVHTAESGMKGLEIAKRENPDLIFLDLKMPEMDGVETLRRLKQVLPKIPVHILTAFHQDYLRPLVELAAEDIDFDLTRKPIDQEQILNIVTMFCSEFN